MESSILVTIFVGFCVLLGFLFTFLKRQSTENGSTSAESEELLEDNAKQNNRVSSKKHGKTTGISSGVPWRATSESNSTVKQTAFCHPWLVTSLKGHSARVSSMDFSTNGKFLATCAEDPPILDRHLRKIQHDASGSESPGSSCHQDSSLSSSSSSSSSASSRPSSTDLRPKLSRRQRKNRLRADHSPQFTSRTPPHQTVNMSNNASHQKKTKSKTSIVNTRRSSTNAHTGTTRQPAAPLRQHTKLNLSEPDLIKLLRTYLLGEDQFLALGYPVESALYPSRAIIYKPSVASNKTQGHAGAYNVNATEFVPQQNSQLSDTMGTLSGDSGQGSSDEDVLPNDATKIHANGNQEPMFINRKFCNTEDRNRFLYSDISKIYKDKNQGALLIADDTHKTQMNQKNVYLTSDNVSHLTYELSKFTNEDIASTNEKIAYSSITDKSIKNGLVLTPSFNNWKQITPGELIKSKDQKTFQLNRNHTFSLEASNRKQSAAEIILCKDQLSYTSQEKTCARCGKGFFVTIEGEYLTQEHCSYHWGRLQPRTGFGQQSGKPQYSCCGNKPESRGCQIGRLHVWNGLDPGMNGPLSGYVRTKPSINTSNDYNPGVYALDCEMCYTACGLELTKLTVVGSDGRLIYDAFVKPDNEIVDYNTRYSGITPKDLSRRGANCKTLREVQEDLLQFIKADTILIGHGLENDLRALRLLHSTIVDTAVAFPHYCGLPFRRSLRSLASSFLKRDIQVSGSGHDSFEDARTCIELMLWRVRKDFRGLLQQQ